MTGEQRNPFDALTREDRAWLRAHGWTPPPPRARWVDDEFVVECEDCGKNVPVEYTELNVDMLVGPVRYVGDTVGALRDHARTCTGQETAA